MYHTSFSCRPQRFSSSLTLLPLSTGGGTTPSFDASFEIYVVEELQLQFELLQVHSLVHDTTQGTTSIDLSSDSARRSLTSNSLPFNLPLPNEGLLTVSVVFIPDENIVIPLSQRQQALPLLSEAVVLLGSVVAYQEAQAAVKSGGVRQIRRGAQDLRTKYVPFFLPGRERVRDEIDARRSEREQVRNARRQMIKGAVTSIASTVGSAISSTITGWLAGGGQKSTLGREEALLPPPSASPHEDLGRAVVLFAQARQVIPSIPIIDTAQLGE